jgi:thymidylate synthase
MWPLYFKDRLEMGNPLSTVAICCLWTPKELIKNTISSSHYTILGQLYTKKGINYILRNILANPFIIRIYLVGSDLMGSGQALLNLYQLGITSDNKIIGDEAAEIEKEIPIDAINDFRKNVEIVDMRGAEHLKNFQNLIKPCKHDSKLWATPRVFPDPPSVEISSYPSERGLIKIERLTIAEAYPAVLKHVLDFGNLSEAMIGYVSDTSKKLKELLNLAVVISSPSSAQDIPDVFPFSQTDLESYLKGFFAPNRGTEDYTYGERLFNFGEQEMSRLMDIFPFLKIDRFKPLFQYGGFDQVEGSIVRKLRKFPYDKGAIAVLANVFTDVFPQRPPKKTPCLSLIQCQIYNNKLNLTAYFRSNDMYNAWPLNAFALESLQKNISEKLHVGVGAFVTISNMAHIYEHNWSDAQKIVDKHYKLGCLWDERGNFIVQTDLSKGEIVVKLMTPDGKTEIRSWKIDGRMPKAARGMCFMIEQDLGVSTIGNAMYIGRQLERAEMAIKLGVSYSQDEALQF